MSRSILRNTAVVAVLTALSRVLGLVREMFQSRLIGAGVEQSAFVVAFAIPNMARRMFGEGALTAAFVPVFKGELEADETLRRAERLARAVMTMSLLMLAAGVVLIWTFVSGALWADGGAHAQHPQSGVDLRACDALLLPGSRRADSHHGRLRRHPPGLCERLPGPEKRHAVFLMIRSEHVRH